jgi:hypothetical protein
MQSKAENHDVLASMLQTVDKRMATACALKDDRLRDQLARGRRRNSEESRAPSTEHDHRQGRSQNEPSRRSSEKSFAFEAVHSHFVGDPHHRANRKRSSSRPNHEGAHGGGDDDEMKNYLAEAKAQRKAERDDSSRSHLDPQDAKLTNRNVPHCF